MRRAPAGRRILVGERQLDFLRGRGSRQRHDHRGRTGGQQKLPDQSILPSGTISGHSRALLPPSVPSRRKRHKGTRPPRFAIAKFELCWRIVIRTTEIPCVLFLPSCLSSPPQVSPAPKELPNERPKQPPKPRPKQLPKRPRMKRM